MTSIPYFGYIAAICSAFLWSIAVVIFKSVSKELSPFLINAIKNSIAFFLFFLLFNFLGLSLWYDGFLLNDYIIIIISGILGMGIGDSLFIYALSRIKANQAAIVDTMAPVINYFLSFIILGTILNVSQTIGSLIVIAAILFIAYENKLDKNQEQVDKTGIILQIVATVSSCYGIVILKPVLNKVSDSIQLQIWVTVFRLLPGMLIAWVIFFSQNNSIFLLSKIKNKDVIIKMVMGSFIGTFMALSFWIIGYANIPEPPIASIIGQTAVIFITIFSSIYLNEKITKIKLFSILIAIFGVCIVIF
tara:strand:+ start:224 stop:1135 length:912 start_codon:yes stop_codon:yes gene_type:complete